MLLVIVLVLGWLCSCDIVVVLGFGLVVNSI